MGLFLNMAWIVVYVTCASIYGLSYAIESEPKCHSKFEYDFQVVQKLVMLENQQKELNKQHLDQQKVIAELEQELRVLQDVPHWSDWGTWSGCFSDCSGSNTGRVQNRTRETTLSSGRQESETERRPCNAVQFAGCVKSSDDRDNYGVIYDYRDQLAQATCTAMAAGGYTNAVRRTCSSDAPDCNTICKNVGRTCFNQLHVYTGTILKRSDVGKLGLQMYKYNSCSGNFCGPNFCCCRK